MVNEAKVQRVLSSFGADQVAFIKSVALDKVQNKLFSKQLSDLQAAYDDLWKVLIVILHAQPSNTLQIHDSQFLRFNQEYRIDKTYDETDHCIVLKLRTIHDDSVVK